MSNKKEYDFSKLYKNKMEERLVKYLEVAAGLYNDNLSDNVQAQVALVSRSIENIALMLAENGYVNSRGYFTRFCPDDLLVIQNALTAALKLRSDIMMLPLGLDEMGKAMGTLSKVTVTNKDTTNPNVGLSEPPPMIAVDDNENVVYEDPMSKPMDNKEDIMVPVLLPSKIK